MKHLFYLLFFNLFITIANSETLMPNTQDITATTPSVQIPPWAKSWWMKRHQAKLKEKKKRGEKNIELVFLGDSIIHQWESKGAKTWKYYYAKYNALNLGFGADRTEQVLWRLDHGAIDNLTPKVLVLMIGTNNAGHRKEPAAQTALGIKAIINRIHEKTPTTKILLLAIFPRGENNQDPYRQLTHQTNAIIKHYADNDDSVNFLAINSIFLDENGNLSKDVMGDFLHPNPEQYPRWAEAMQPTLEKLLK